MLSTTSVALIGIAMQGVACAGTDVGEPLELAQGDVSMENLEGLEALRTSCPEGSSLVGPVGPAGETMTVNGRFAAFCAREDGTYHGPSVAWYANGKKAQEGSYRDGDRDGNWMYWYDSGIPRGRGAFAGDKPEGEWRTWYENGAIKSEELYSDGKHHGVTRQFDKNGRLSRTLHYERGELKRVEEHRD